MAAPRRLSLEDIDRILDGETVDLDDYEPSEADDFELASARFSPPRRPRRGPTRPQLVGSRPEDLPLLEAISGYRRDRRGTWRYEVGGDAVPGARDLTLHRLYRFEPDELGDVHVPDHILRFDAALGWVRRVGRCRVETGLWSVEWEEWEDRAHWPLGMDAPELAPTRLIDVSTLATLLGGVRPSTVTAYLARGRLPRPQFVAAGRPLWSLPVLLRHWKSQDAGRVSDSM